MSRAQNMIRWLYSLDLWTTSSWGRYNLTGGLNLRGSSELSRQVAETPDRGLNTCCKLSQYHGCSVDEARQHVIIYKANF